MTKLHAFVLAPLVLTLTVATACGQTVGSDVTMSVCVGAYVLAKTGLLDGKSAATHHAAYKDFANDFPKVHVVRGVRFVEEGNLATSGGLSCGIDLALQLVDRYFGREVAEATAYNLEYQGQGWKNNSNAIYAQATKGRG